nr:hypothetical protein CPGR_00602 [Mycolicibacter nonchromogenicus]
MIAWVKMTSSVVRSSMRLARVGYITHWSMPNSSINSMRGAGSW